ncbi:hypothetical protein CFBP5507_05905 [Agrobacterium salinitolerans]|uniref:Uncharacterized protein n=1 Tax=Agrobacterium salinitolerans TaxID=1183413 RepID=A0A4Z1QZ11_9HYPH|nr:hypothetical protein [Agrobacterium salinitolerans]UYZ08533.1 hypothetical protein CFBP5507_05905 [Agrobacterium salinitolerans]
MRYILALMLAFAGVQFAHAATESEYRSRFCAGMQQERVLPNGTRVDCITDHMAIEVDWTHKWAEAIGQSLLYAAATEKLPAIILVCKVDPAGCLKHEYLISEAVAYWKLPITVWLCMPTDISLSACKRRDY